MTTIALISPGAMGASVGAAAASNGHEVLWLNPGRSERTLARAKRANLIAVTSEEDLFSCAEIVLSVCPPHSAEEVAALAVRNNFKGTFVEANAISPNKTRSIASKLAESNITCVDGGIIGGPAWNADSNTHLYLSGTGASTIASLFKDSPLMSSIVDANIGSASALKMTFAAYSKGTTALLAAILAVAEQEEIREVLQNQWGKNFTQQTITRVTGNATKAWRFAGEMEEISKTFSDAGLPGDFHTGAAEVFRRLSDYKDVPTPPALAEFLTTLIDNK